MKTEMIPLTKITPAPFQPRKTFDPEKMEELAASLEAQGLLHPILVRPLNGGFQLIAGERRFRAAKAIGWKEIRAEVEVMGDLEAEEKSAVENFQRGDLTGQEVENVVHDLWVKGKEERYKSSMETLGKRLGFTKQRISALVEAKEARERLGFKVLLDDKKSATTRDLDKTSGIKDDADRKKLIEKKMKGDIHADEVEAYTVAVRNSSPVVKDAVLDKPKMFTPKVAEKLSALPDTVQLGAIATIKKSKMDEESAMEFVNEVHYAKPEVQTAMMEDPKHITPAVAKELSKLTTKESQKSTIETIKAHRLTEEEAVGVTKMMSSQEDFSKEHVEEIAEREREYLKLMREYEQGKLNPFIGKKKSRVGKAFLNIMAHMRLVQAVHSDGCTCPHCGKEGTNYLRWTCCSEGKEEVLDQAYQYARDQHQRIVKEEKVGKAGG